MMTRSFEAALVERAKARWQRFEGTCATALPALVNELRALKDAYGAAAIDEMLKGSAVPAVKSLESLLRSLSAAVSSSVSQPSQSGVPTVAKKRRKKLGRGHEHRVAVVRPRKVTFAELKPLVRDVVRGFGDREFTVRDVVKALRAQHIKPDKPSVSSLLPRYFTGITTLGRRKEGPGPKVNVYRVDGAIEITNYTSAVRRPPSPKPNSDEASSVAT